MPKGSRHAPSCRPLLFFFSSFFLRVSPDGVFIGTGFDQSCPAHQKSLRTSVANEDTGRTLASVAKKLRKADYELQGKHYKRFPRGVPREGPSAEFLLHNALYVVVEDKPEVAEDSGLLDLCTQHWKATFPLHRWLIAHVHWWDRSDWTRAGASNADSLAAIPRGASRPSPKRCSGPAPGGTLGRIWR